MVAGVVVVEVDVDESDRDGDLAPTEVAAGAGGATVLVVPADAAGVGTDVVERSTLPAPAAPPLCRDAGTGGAGTQGAREGQKADNVDDASSCHRPHTSLVPFRASHRVRQAAIVAERSPRRHHDRAETSTRTQVCDPSARRRSNK